MRNLVRLATSIPPPIYVWYRNEGLAAGLNPSWAMRRGLKAYVDYVGDGDAPPVPELQDFLRQVKTVVYVRLEAETAEAIDRIAKRLDVTPRTALRLGLAWYWARNR